MRNCPKCSKPVDGSVCRACGYADDGAGTPSRRGGRCEAPGCDRWGTFKPEAKAGPWHCFKHYPAVPMPDWFRREHPEFAAKFKPLSDAEIERDAERYAIQHEGE